MCTDDRGVIEEIAALKRKRNAVLLVHNYQRPEVQAVADHLGDSLELSRIASRSTAEVIVFCGVRFMAETAAILAPDRTVLLPRAEAGCPMADMITAAELRAFRDAHPGAPVVAYVNTTAAVKAEADVCCTSANAVAVVRNIEGDRVLFVPDRNLADWCRRSTDKEVIAWEGFCIVHQQITEADVAAARADHPSARLIVHPECRPGVVALADEVLSTGGMVRHVRESSTPEFIIGTEAGLIDRLAAEHPDRRFHHLVRPRICRNMKLTTLDDVAHSLGAMEHRIEVEPEIAGRARGALERMLRYA